MKKAFWKNVWIEITNHCNLQCTKCTQQRAGRPKGYLDLAVYRKIIHEIAQQDPDCRVWLGLGGEPLLVRFQLYYMIRYAKGRGLKNICLRTNGVLLTEEMAEMLLDAGTDHILVTAGQVQPDTARDTAYRNVQYFIKRKEERNMETIQVQVTADQPHKTCLAAEIPGGGDLRNETADKDSEADTKTCAVLWDGTVTTNLTGTHGTISYGNLQESSLAEIRRKESRPELMSDF